MPLSFCDKQPKTQSLRGLQGSLGLLVAGEGEEGHCTVCGGKQPSVLCKARGSIMTQTEYTATLAISLSLWAMISYTSSGMTPGLAGNSVMPGKYCRGQELPSQSDLEVLGAVADTSQEARSPLFLPQGSELTPSIHYIRFPECPF